jgi:hypothetical protein
MLKKQLGFLLTLLVIAPLVVKNAASSPELRAVDRGW